MLVQVMRPFSSDIPMERGDVLDTKHWPVGRMEQMISQRHVQLYVPAPRKPGRPRKVAVKA